MEESDRTPGDGQQPSGRRQPEHVPTSAPPAVPSPVSSGSGPWAGCGGRGLESRRWASVGCGVAVLVLVALLLAGVSLTKRSAWMAFARGRQRLVEAVGRDHPMERLRTTRNLELFAARLRVSRDPYRTLGEFLQRVRAGFADGGLDADELEELNRFLERSASPSDAGPGP